MKLCHVSILVLSTIGTTTAIDTHFNQVRDVNATTLACAALKSAYDSEVFFPGDANYTAENEHFWTPTDYLAPECAFTPTSATQLSAAIIILAQLQATFAVRGGGHMPIPGYANTNGGVLIGLTNLNELQLSANQSILSVGPGRRWGEVYSYLEPYGLVVVGGRIGIVGVPGLLLGGGISLYSNQHGFASDNVVAYEVVLASGEVVTATSTQYPDLFWSLKGGGNSFGIVTRFDLLTYNSPNICIGSRMFPSTEKDAFLSALVSFGEYGSADSKAALIPSVFISQNSTYYSSVLFYDGTECDQSALENFTAIPATEDTYGPSTLATFAEGISASFPDGTRQVLQVMSSLANADALSIMHDTFVDMVTTDLLNVTGLGVSGTFQPIAKNFIQQGINKGGNPQGVDISKAPYFWLSENLSWTDPADDELIYEFTAKVTDALEAKLVSAGQQAQYKYMNDAGLGQEIFQNYGDGNLEKLQAIRAKYDPSKVFTSLMPGGWKVDTA